MQNTYLYKYLLEIDSNFNLPLFYKERIFYALSQLKTGKSLERTVTSPHNLNDLGVRKDEESLKLFQILSNALNLPEIDFQAIEQDIKKLSSNQLGYYLDSYILCIGDYIRIKNAVIQKSNRLEKIESFENAIYLATYLASINNLKCITLYREAIFLSSNLIDKITAQHRICAFCIKRLNDFDKSELELEKLKQYIISSDNLETKSIYLSLYNNLYCLHLLNQSTDKNVVKSLLDDAVVIIDLNLSSLNNDNRLKNQSIRYKSQININRAQLCIFEGNYKMAIKILMNNIKYVEQYAPEYLAECFSVLSYTFYLDKKYNEALEYGKKGLFSYLEIGSIVKANAIKEILVTVLYKLGDSKSALDLLEIPDYELLVTQSFDLV